MQVPRLQQLLEASALSTGAGIEGAFLSDSIVTRPGYAPVWPGALSCSPVPTQAVGQPGSACTPPLPPTVRS